MRRLLATLALLPAAVLAAGPGPNILGESQHAAASLVNAFTTSVGAGVLNTAGGVYFDTTVPNEGPCASAFGLVTDTTTKYYRYPGGAQESAAKGPYGITYTSCSWFHTIPTNDVAEYALAVSASAIDTFPYVNSDSPVASGTGPASAGTTIGITGQAGSGWGAEFSLSASDPNATSFSGANAAFTGYLAALKYLHPTASWFDIKAALRQTAANWSTGWSSTTWGYGTINPFGTGSADALLTSGTIYLQPPNVDVVSGGWFAALQIYPMRTARRDHEEVYSVAAGYTFPAPSTGSGSEYTAADIASIVAGGHMSKVGTTAGNSAVIPIVNFAAASGTYTLIVFTVDSSGNASRTEVFSPHTVSLTTLASCVY